MKKRLVRRATVAPVSRGRDRAVRCCAPRSFACSECAGARNAGSGAAGQPDSIIWATVTEPLAHHRLVGRRDAERQGCTGEGLRRARHRGERSGDAADDVRRRVGDEAIHLHFVAATVEQKKLGLDDPIAKWYPNLTRAKDITLRDLGGHLSGYRDYYPLDFVDQEMAKDKTPDAIINEYATRPLDFEPRSRYSYSNTGFLLLGRVVEKVSGQTFGAYLQQHIFTPLNMAHSTFEPAKVTGDMATGYTSFALAPAIPAVPEAKGWASTAGAIWSTPTDLLDGIDVDSRSQAAHAGVVRVHHDGATSDRWSLERIRLRRRRKRSRTGDRTVARRSGCRLRRAEHGHPRDAVRGGAVDEL